MEQSGQNNKIVELPNIMASYKAKKRPSWGKGFIDYYTSSSSNNGGKRKTTEEMDELISFYNSVITRQELKKHLDPLGVDDSDEVTDAEQNAFSFYDILAQPLSTLFGEHLKRTFDVRAYAINPDVVNEKDKEFREQAMQKFSTLAQQRDKLSEEQMKAKVEEIELMLKNDLQTAHEAMANSILKVIQQDNDIKSKYVFNKGFKSYQILAETIFKVDHVGNDPKFRHVDSRNFRVFGIDESNFVEDGYAWVETRYMHPFDIVREFSKDLSDSEIKRILEDNTGGLYNPIMKYDAVGGIYNSSNYENIPYVVLPGEKFDRKDYSITDGKALFNAVNKSGSGLIRVERVEWKALKKIGLLQYLDDDGTEQKTWVPEEYEVQADLNEQIEWFYAEEIYEGTLILDDIYARVRPLPVQMRKMSNPFTVKPSYFGYINSYGGVKSQSRLERLIPYQRMFNIWMQKLITLWTQNLGKATVVDTARIPKGMNTEQWYMWLKRFGLMFENSFEMGKEGTAKGQLAGHMQLGNRVVDLSLANEIDQAIKMLSWIEEMVNKIAAVPAPRQGQMSGNEGLGVSQQAIIQSTQQTEEDFYIMDLLEAKGYELILEYAKNLWRDDNFKKQYLLDDLSAYVLEVDGALLNEAEYGIKITNSAKMYQLTNTMQSLYHAAMQTGAATLSDIASLMMTESPSEMLVKLRQTEEKRIKQQQSQQEQQGQLQQQQLQAQQEMMQIKHQQDLEKLQLEWEFKLMEAELNRKYDAYNHSLDTNRNGIEDQVELDKEKIVQDTAKLKIASEEKIAREEMQNKIQIAHINAKKAASKSK